jgi:hypothetical protein
MPNARSINLNQDFPSWYLVGVWEGYTHLSYNVTTPTDYYITFIEDSAEISYPDGRVENYCKYSTLGTDSNANDIGFYFSGKFSFNYSKTRDRTFIIHDIEFESKYVEGLNTSGFPNEPHIILDLKHSDYKPYEVRTDHGYSPKERYFKIVKKEKRFTEYKETKSGLKLKTLDEWRIV